MKARILWIAGVVLVGISAPVGQALASPLPVGHTAVYKRAVGDDCQVWVATRINQEDIAFLAWGCPLSSFRIVWRSGLQYGRVYAESAKEIYYHAVRFRSAGVPTDIHGLEGGGGAIWLTATSLDVALPGQPRSTHALLIGYGVNAPTWYTKQWCSPGQICPPSGLPWSGWPLYAVMLNQLFSPEAVVMLVSPFTDGLETIQGYRAAIDFFRGYATIPCGAWADALGLCSGGALYRPGAGETLRISHPSDGPAQWWFDANQNDAPECGEFHGPHGLAPIADSSTAPTQAEGTWAASSEGACR